VPRRTLSNATLLNRKVATNEARQHLRIVPQTENDKGCLLRLLDASASLWNELTYERRQNYFGDGDVWDTSEYRGQYNGVIGSATVQQVTRKTRKRGGRSSPLKRKARTLTPVLLGQRGGGTRTPYLHPKRPVHDSVGQAVASRNSCRARVKRRIRTWLPRTIPPRSPRQPEVGWQTEPSGT